MIVKVTAMSFASECCVCAKPLPDVRGPELMDRQGRVYHFACWSRLMESRIHENRQWLERLSKKSDQPQAGGHDAPARRHSVAAGG
jgi:hypothetical protein